MPVEPDFGEPVIPIGDPPQSPVKVSFPELDTLEALQRGLVELAC